MMKRILPGALLSAATAIGACDGSTVVLGGTGASASSSPTTSTYPWDLTSAVSTGAGGSTSSDPGQGGIGSSSYYPSSTTGAAVGPGLTCAGLFSPSPSTSTWNMTLTKPDFEPGPSFQDYVALNTCVCVKTMDAQGCADLCRMGEDGSSTPNWCDGVGASVECNLCLDYWCSPQFDACTSD